MAIGTFGMGQVVGVFQRTLPPRSKIYYDPGYELALEVQRWFHYRHDLDVIVQGYKITDSGHLTDVMLTGYKRYFRTKMRYWDTLQEQAFAWIREFKEIFKDVLGEMEFTKTAE